MYPWDLNLTSPIYITNVLYKSFYLQNHIKWVYFLKIILKINENKQITKDMLRFSYDKLAIYESRFKIT